MIVDHTTMKAIEASSGFTLSELMDKAGSVCAEELAKEAPGSSILILCGKGNNGGDGYVMASLLKDRYDIRVFQVEGAPATPLASEACAKVDPSLFISRAKFEKTLEECTVVVDAVYGFGYHGVLKPELKKLFRMVNDSGKKVYSIDINSGCEADTGFCDMDAICSDVTLALDCYKPFHVLRKNHQMFREVRLLSLGLPHENVHAWPEMNEELFFASLPKKTETSYKGTFGKITLIGGSYGMAGAMCLNILGARTVGASYIQAALPEEIYPLVAPKYITTVYHPYSRGSWRTTLEPVLRNASAVCFGSGCVNLPDKDKMMDFILQNVRCPVVLDAEAIRLLIHNTYILRFLKAPLIMTPHIGEFAALFNKPMQVIEDHYLDYAVQFAKENNVILVLKKPNTVVVSPCGDIYINQSGNEALAQAGSGDLLTGIITALASMMSDTYKAVCMGVWLHGFLADRGIDGHSKALFDLERFPELMDQVFAEHDF